MANLNATKWGSGVGSASSTFSTARTTTTANVTPNGTGHSTVAVKYARTGRGQHSFNRMFYYFDTSEITGSVSSVTLNIQGYTGNDDGDVIVIKSTAFGGDGSADLVSSEFSSLDYNTTYSSEITSWSLSGNNAITLDSDAESDIQNNNAFIVAIVNHDNDFQNSAGGSAVSDDNSINFLPIGFLSYTETASGYTHDVSGLAAASIGKVSSVATASIGKINSVD